VALSLLVDEGFYRIATAALAIMAGVFLVEFAVRFWDAESRVAYLRDHWIDLLTCLPPIGPLRAMRLLRLIGLLRLAQQMRDIAHTKAETSGRTDGSPTWIVWPTTLLLWLGAAEGFWIVERGHNPPIQTFGDALYLAFITVTTVGYGDVRPVTSEGKVLAGGLVFLGLGLLGFISAQMTARWLRTERGESQIEKQLAALTLEVSEVKHLLRQARGDYSSIESATDEAEYVRP
jgi:voltage-gated potassium channel